MKRSTAVLVLMLLGMIACGGFGYLGLRLWQGKRSTAGSEKTEAQWLEELRSPDSATGAKAGVELAALGEAGLPILLKARAGVDMRAHRQAVRALSRMGAIAAGPLVDTFPASGDRAALALARMGGPDAVGALILGLREPEKSQQVARVLGDLGSQASPAVPALLALLQDRQGSAEGRAEAASALGKIGPEAEKVGVPDPIVPALASALEDSSVQVRQRAAEALAEIGPDAGDAVPSLARALRNARSEAPAICWALDRTVTAGNVGRAAALRALAARATGSDDRGALAAAEALARLGPLARPVVPELVSALPERQQAVRLALRGLGATAVPGLAEDLKNPDPERVEAAALALLAIGEPARTAIPELLECWKRQQEHLAIGPFAVVGISPDLLGGLALLAVVDRVDLTTQALALSIAQIDPEKAGPVIPFLVRRLKDEADPNILLPILETLGWLGSTAQEARGELLALLPAGGLRSRVAAEALVRLGPPEGVTAQARLALKEAPKSPEMDLRLYYLALLAQMGPAAKDALPEVKAALKVERLRPLAALTLARIDPTQSDEAVMALQTDLESDLLRPRLLALRVLAQLGASAGTTVPWLRSCLREPELVHAALDVVDEVGASAAPLVPDLIGLLSEKNAGVVFRSRTALVRIGPAAVPGLLGALSSPNTRVRQEAIVLLGQFGKTAGPAVSALIAVLQDPDTKVALLAAEALGEIGPESAAAGPKLLEWLNGWETDQRRMAARVLGRLGKEAQDCRADLLLCLFDPDEVVRAYAANSLGQLSYSDEVRDGLLGALRDPHPRVRLAAATSLAGLDKNQANRVIATLLSLAKGPSPTLRHEATDVLLGIAPAQAADLVPLLQADLRSLDHTDSLRAAHLLGKIKPNDAGLVPRLLLTLKVGNGSEIRDSLTILGELGASARSALPVLLRLASTITSAARYRALRETIQRINPEAASKIPAEPLPDVSRLLG